MALAARCHIIFLNSRKDLFVFKDKRLVHVPKNTAGTAGLPIQDLRVLLNYGIWCFHEKIWFDNIDLLINLELLVDRENHFPRVT